MKQDLYTFIDEHRQEIFDLGDRLFHNPELGFREFRTGEIIREYLQKHDLKVDREYCYTGFSVTIGSGSPHIGIIAELDAIPTQGHPCADPVTTAAHACGHSTQVVITLAALTALSQQISDLKGTVTLYFTPAEEFTDLEYRKKLVQEGKIRYLSGKQNMLAQHIFDDADCIIHLHASGDKRYHFSVDSVLSGFIHKKITFLGKASHAAVLPQYGINALHEATLFINAINMLRETFVDEDMTRIHGIIDDGGNTVNSIPDKVVYECYVRTVNADVLHELNAKVTNAAKCCAKAIGGDCIVEDTPGYLPLHQNDKLNEVIYENILNFADPKEVKWHEYSAAAGDVGDICVFKPIIQYGYSGISGRIHGPDMRIEDPEEVYITQAKIVAGSVFDLLSNPERVQQIRDSFTPTMTYEEYIEYLEGR